MYQSQLESTLSAATGTDKKLSTNVAPPTEAGKSQQPPPGVVPSVPPAVSTRGSFEVEFGTSFLAHLLREVSAREDVCALAQRLCEDVSVESVSAESATVDLCGRVIEPVCRALEALASIGLVPSSLRGAVRVLVSTDCEVTATNFLASCIVPAVVRYVAAQCAKKEGQIRVTGQLDWSQQTAERVKGLLNSCFQPDVGKQSLFCLSDTAALSRSKWLISRSIELMANDRTAASSGLTGSPVGKLASLCPLSGRLAAMSGVVCMRPSELMFLLECMDVGSVTSTALAATSRELSDGISSLQSSNLLARMTAAAYQHQIRLSGRSGNVSASLCALDGDSAVILQVDALSTFHHLEPLDDQLSLSVGADALDLLSPVAEATVEPEEGGLNELSSLQWLISAARSALSAVYDQRSLSRSVSTVRELQQLKQNLASKQQLITNCILDFNRIELCRDLCLNFRSQLQLRTDQWRQRRVGQEPAALLGAMPSPADCPLSDEECNAAIAKIVMMQLRMESDLGRRPLSTAGSASAGPLSPSSKSMSRTAAPTSPSSSGPIDNKKPSKLAALAATRTKRVDVGANHSGRGDSSKLQAGGPNPLWVLMQSVFSSTPSPSKAGSQ